MFNRALGPKFKVFQTYTGAQAKGAIKAAPSDTNANLQFVGLTGYVTTQEAGKFLTIWSEENATVPLYRRSLAAVGPFSTPWLGEEGINLAVDKDLQAQSDATTAVVEFVALYRINPPGGDG